MGGVLSLHVIPRLSCILKLYPSRENLRFYCCKRVLLVIRWNALSDQGVVWVVSGLGDHVPPGRLPRGLAGAEVASGVVALKQKDTG